MKILITGGSGFLGRRAIAHFTQLGYEVLAPSHNQLDITDSASVNRWYLQNQPQITIHCAAISDTGVCQKDPAGSAIVNVQGSTNLASACAAVGGKFIFCSSDQVYASSSLAGPHKENEVLTPNAVYAQQKLLAEQQCRHLCDNTVSLRLSWMYASCSYPNEHGHLLSTLLDAIRNPDHPITFPIYDKRGITNVEEVVQQLPQAITFPPGIYNFGAENDTDTYHTICKVLESLQLSDVLTRMTPNLQAFSASPRDIRMDTSLAASYGACYASTASGLSKALSQNL